MELPDWVVDEVIQPATPVAVRLVIILYRHGRQVVDSSGSRRVYWRGSTAELARLTGVSKRHLIAAEHYLADASFLTLHNQTRPNAPHAISARYDRPETRGGYKLSPLAESQNPHHGDASNTDPFDQLTEEPDTTTTTQAAVTICNRLTEWGVTSPLRWLAQFGTERVTAALAAFEAEHASDARNPAGFLYTLLTSPETTSTLIARSRATTPALSEEDDFEAQKRRFLGGPLGHIVKYGAAIE